MKAGLPGRPPAGKPGSIVAEMALVAPILILFILACLQFAIVVNTYVSVMNVGRQAGRWISVHPHTTDAAMLTEIVSRLPANLNAAALTVSFSPACTSLNNGKCDSRPVNSQVSITLTYNLTGKLFLPTNFQIMNHSVAIPATLPSYTVYMKVEPT